MNSQSTLDARLARRRLATIDAICDRFEADCLAGRRPDLASYLVGSSRRGDALCSFTTS